VVAIVALLAVVWFTTAPLRSPTAATAQAQHVPESPAVAARVENELPPSKGPTQRKQAESLSTGWTSRQAAADGAEKVVPVSPAEISQRATIATSNYQPHPRLWPQPSDAINEESSSSPDDAGAELDLVSVATPHLRTTGPVTLRGAGTTFPTAMFARWFSEYRKIDANVEFDYRSIGSGAGIKQFQSQVVDFGASDGPMTDEQIHQTPAGVIHVPTVLNAVVPIYNLTGVTDLNFTPELLAGIFLGKIRKWNDPELAKANPGVQFPDADIVVIHRSEASAVTYIFTDYLSKVSPEWRDRVGKSTSVNWPVGRGSQGCEGIAGTVKQTEGSIGYVELIYALQNKTTFGSVQNSAGQSVKASLESVTAAAASVKPIPDDFRVSITNAPGKTAYPISSFTWLLLPGHAKDPARGQELFEFVEWMLGQGQTMAPCMSFAPLPMDLARQVRRRLAQVRQATLQ
jgi:phosphate transport system substrate-binding protein